MNESAGNILVVDDDVSVRRALAAVLKSLSFEVSASEDAEDAIVMTRTFKYDAVLLDISLPGMSGITACRAIRDSRADIGILMLTVHQAAEKLIQALDAGADDYVVKPFHVGELAARLRAVIRRTRQHPRFDGPVKIGEVAMNPLTRTVTVAGRPVHLTPKEFDLLRLLMSNAGFPIPHARLLAVVWGPEYGGELEYLRTFVRQLRKKVEPDPSQPRYLLTVSHVGYRFSSSDELELLNT